MIKGKASTKANSTVKKTNGNLQSDRKIEAPPTLNSVKPKVFIKWIEQKPIGSLNRNQRCEQCCLRSKKMKERFVWQCLINHIIING